MAEDCSNVVTCREFVPPWQPENIVVSYDPDEPAVVFTDTATGATKRHSLIDDNPAGSFKDWDK